MRIRKVVLLLSFTCFMLLLYNGVAGAVEKHDSEINLLPNNTFNVFFYTPVEVFNARVSFTERVGFTLEGFQGNGYYVVIGNGFLAIYFAVDEAIGLWNGDITFVMLGVNVGPFVFGTGAVLVEYQDLYPMVFQGLQE